MARGTLAAVVSLLLRCLLRVRVACFLTRKGFRIYSVPD